MQQPIKMARTGLIRRPIMAMCCSTVNGCASASASDFLAGRTSSCALARSMSDDGLPSNGLVERELVTNQWSDIPLPRFSDSLPLAVHEDVPNWDALQCYCIKISLLTFLMNSYLLSILLFTHAICFQSATSFTGWRDGRIHTLLQLWLAVPFEAYSLPRHEPLGFTFEHQLLPHYWY